MGLDEEQQPFLCSETVEKEDLSGNVRRGGPQRGKHRLLVISVLSNVVLLVICAILSASLLSTSDWHHLSPIAVGNKQIPEKYSPANAVIEYEYRQVISNDPRYVGKPGPEWEEQMHRLMNGTLLRVSQEEIDLYGSTSIALEDGGYAAGLGVAHNLHCVKKIKKLLYREQYYSDLSAEEFDYTRSHADHCLDWLRQAIMCHADYSMYTLYWGERQQEIPTHKIPGPQKCVNWDKLHEWMLSRAANTDMLVPPKVEEIN